MTRVARHLAVGLTAVVWITAQVMPARAETVELVTYYPSQTNTGDLHVQSLTVGNEIRGDTPPNGVALVFDALGIGLNPGTTDPAGPLEVVGLNDLVSRVILRPGADTAAAGLLLVFGSGIRRHRRSDFPSTATGTSTLARPVRPLPLCCNWSRLPEGSFRLG